MTQASRLLVARNVINLRHASNLSQAELAVRSGLHRSYVGSIEQARRNVSIDTLDRLADALGVQARDLFSGTSQPAAHVFPDGAPAAD